MRAKIMLLIALAAVGGSLVGMIEVYVGHQAYVLGGGLCLVVSLLFMLGRRWCWRPLEDLVTKFKPLHRESRPEQLRTLPMDRHDEIGQIARTVHHLIAWTIREHVQSRQLRRTFDDQIGNAIAKATVNLEKLAMRDPLTGLGNRRFVDENLQQLVQTANDTETDLVVIVMDVDNFKQVNDTLGHATGDELLIFIASLTQAAIRSDDYAIRLGGDEFVLVMPGCNIEQASAITQRMTTLFTQHCQVAFTTADPVGLSVGMASLTTEQVSTAAELVDIADQRLYTAKRSGKNRMVVR